LAATEVDLTPMTRAFTAELVSQGPTGAWTKLDIPFKVEDAFGSRGRVSVQGTINGFAFRTSVFPNGDGTHHMMVNKAMQQGAKAKPRDMVKLTLQRDQGAQTVEVPPDVKRALAKNKRAAAAFDKLAPSHRPEHIRAIMEAKKPETRVRRIERMIEKLLEP
jgi:hypothetical protein